MELLYLHFSFFFTASVSSAELKIDSVYPTIGELDKEMQVTMRGTGFDNVERIVMSLDVANEKDIIGSADIFGTDIELVDNIAYVPNCTGINVLDVSDPVQPVLLGKLDYSNGCSAEKGVKLSGNTAYIGDWDGRYCLRIVDISNKKNPVLISTLELSDEIEEIDVFGNTVYVANKGMGLLIVDVTNRSNPSIIGRLDSLSRTSAVRVNESAAYVADKYDVYIVNIDNPAKPQIISSLNLNWAYVNDIEIDQNRAYLATSDGLKIVDIRNKLSPVLIGTLDFDYTTKIALSGNRAYVAALESGIYVIDISDPSIPAIVGSIDTPSHILGFAVSNRYAYTVGSGFQIVDVFNPSPSPIFSSIATSAPESLFINPAI